MSEDLARCDREIAEIQARPDVVAGTCRAYLPALGVNDWTVERDLIERERASTVLVLPADSRFTR
jgi:hypothetical protein